MANSELGAAEAVATDLMQPTKAQAALGARAQLPA